MRRVEHIWQGVGEKKNNGVIVLNLEADIEALAYRHPDKLKDTFIANTLNQQKCNETDLQQSETKYIISSSRKNKS